MFGFDGLRLCGIFSSERGGCSQATIAVFRGVPITLSVGPVGWRSLPVAWQVCVVAVVRGVPGSRSGSWRCRTVTAANARTRQEASSIDELVRLTIARRS